MNTDLTKAKVGDTVRILNGWVAFQKSIGKPVYPWQKETFEAKVVKMTKKTITTEGGARYGLSDGLRISSSFWPDRFVGIVNQ